MSVVRTCIGSLKKPHIAGLKMIFQKITGDRSCTCSTNQTHFMPIRQTFVLFTRDGRKGLIYPGWEIVHVRWSSILEKWDDSILKQYFGGYFTKRPVFCARKMENGFSVRRKGKLPPATLFSIPMSTCMHNMDTTTLIGSSLVPVGGI